MLASGDGKGLETAVLERGRRRRSLLELEKAGDGRAGNDLKTVELARARRRYRAGPGLEYGGARPELGNGGALPWLGDGEVGRGSETAELARTRRQRSWKGLEDD